MLSAWCLGVLNSHRRFFLSYAAPVLWNLAIIASLVAFGSGTPAVPAGRDRGLGIGAGQPAAVRRAAADRRAAARRASGRGSRAARPRCAEVLRNFGPVFVGRGVVQISAYVDTVLASLLPTGAVAALSYAQVLYTLPVSLFGMSVSAAELPAMSSAVGSESERAAYLRGRLDGGLRQIAFFVVPSAMAFLALGDVVAGALYQSGAFTRAMTVYVWGILAAPPSGCSPRPWAGSTPRPTTRCATPGRRSASPCSASRSRSGWATSSPCRCRARWASSRAGARRASRRPPGSPAGSSSSCSGARSTARIGRPDSAAWLMARLWGAAGVAAAAAWARPAGAAGPAPPDRRGARGPGHLRRGVSSGLTDGARRTRGAPARGAPTSAAAGTIAAAPAG